MYEIGMLADALFSPERLAVNEQQRRFYCMMATNENLMTAAIMAMLTVALFSTIHMAFLDAIRLSIKAAVCPFISLPT